MPFLIKFNSHDRHVVDLTIAEIRQLHADDPNAGWGLIHVEAFGGPFFHVTCETRQAGIRVYLSGLGGINITEFDTPRADVRELYQHTTAREVKGGIGIFLDPYDPEPFALGPDNDEAWAAVAELLQNLPDH